MDLPFKLRIDAELDVVGFGTNAVDHLIRVERYPEFNSKVELTGYELAAGGEIASTMFGLQRLGASTAYAGRFGDDEAGMIGRRSLESSGVDVRHADVIDGASTQIAFIIVDEATGERTIIWHRDKRLAYTAVDAPTQAATRGRILHLTPHDTAACIAMAKAARAAGVVVSGDIDNVFDDIEKLLPLIDIAIVSPDLTKKLWGITEPEESLRTIAERFGCRLVGITLGDTGSLFFSNGEILETAAFDVPGGCVDTTGAGDAFRTGFLFGVLEGWTLEDCARAANAVAALKCRGSGARSAPPDPSELLSLLKKNLDN